MEMVRSFKNPPDHVFVVRGTCGELRQLELSIRYIYWSMIISPLWHPSYPDDQIAERKFTFSDPNEAMRFKLSIP